MFSGGYRYLFTTRYYNAIDLRRPYRHMVNLRVKKLEQNGDFSPTIKQDRHQKGLLLACGLVAGNSLVGVI